MTQTQLAAGKEAGVTIARVARMLTLRGDDIPVRLGDLSPALNPRSDGTLAGLLVILPGEMSRSTSLGP